MPTKSWTMWCWGSNLLSRRTRRVYQETCNSIWFYSSWWACGHSVSNQGWSTCTHTCTRTYSSTFFSVLSCTLYLAKFMSICTRTYLSTVTKKPVLMSTLRVLLSTFLNINQIEKKLFLRPSLICFKCPSSVFFQTWKKVASSIFFRCQNQNIGILCLKWT